MTRFKLLIALFLGVARAAPSLASVHPFLPGEILLNEGGIGASRIQRYSPTGTFEQFYGLTNNPNTGQSWLGASLTPDGNVVTTFQRPTPLKGIDIFSPDGPTIITFTTPAVALAPGDVSAFANGTLAISDQTDSQVQLYTQTGTLIKTVQFPGPNATTPFGNAVGFNNVLYVAGLTSDTIIQVSQDGTILGNTPNLGFQPGDIAVDPLDGTLWVSNRTGDLVQHMLTDGTSLGSFPIGLTGNFDGIALSPDGLTVLATTETSSVIREFTRTGAQLRDIAIDNPSISVFLTVVPVPEPSMLALMGIFTGFLFMGRRRSRRPSY